MNDFYKTGPSMEENLSTNLIFSIVFISIGLVESYFFVHKMCFRNPSHFIRKFAINE